MEEDDSGEKASPEKREDDGVEKAPDSGGEKGNEQSPPFSSPPKEERTEKSLESERSAIENGEGEKPSTSIIPPEEGNTEREGGAPVSMEADGAPENTQHGSSMHGEETGMQGAPGQEESCRGSGSVESLDLFGEEVEKKLAEFREENSQELHEFRELENRVAGCKEFLHDTASALEEFHARTLKSAAAADDIEALELRGESGRIFVNSKAGIDLITRMISRLPSRVPILDESKIPKIAEMQSPRKEEMPKEAGEVKAFLDKLGVDNYRHLSALRRIAEQTENSIFSFLKTHLFPAFDGIRDGKRHFSQNYENLQKSEPGEYTELERLREAFDGLALACSDLVSLLHLEVLEPKQGEPINYDLHEPFDKIDCVNFEDETVYEIVKPGYILGGGLWKEHARVLRPALVLIVKHEAGPER